MTHREAKGLLSSVKDRIQRIRQFYTHLASYIGVLGFLFTASSDPAPVVLILLAWGSAVLYHANSVFGWKGKKTKEWEQAMIHEIMHGEEWPYEMPQIAGDTADQHALLKRIEHLETIVSSKEWETKDEEMLALKE